MRLLRFTEINGWEGEIWNFYVWMDSETESRLRLILQNREAHPYTLGKEEYTEDEVNELMDYESESTYMDEHNLCGILVLPEVVDFSIKDPFYKGKI
jgi:hypothetical protein